MLDKCLRGGPATGGPPQPDADADAPASGPQPGRGFDFYVLALSWSPGFCATGGADRSPDQCTPGRGLGFVVHGLWPQNRRGYPTDCDAGGARTPSRAVLDSVRDLYPEIGLARHEWRQHGTCSGLSPSAYFAAVRRARAAVAIPPDLRSPAREQELAPVDVARAFAASNPGLRPGMMAVTCRRAILAEVRLCLSRDLRGFQSCPEVAQDGCRSQSIAVPAAP